MYVMRVCVINTKSRCCACVCSDSCSRYFHTYEIVARWFHQLHIPANSACPSLYATRTDLDQCVAMSRRKSQWHNVITLENTSCYRYYGPCMILSLGNSLRRLVIKYSVTNMCNTKLNTTSLCVLCYRRLLGLWCDLYDM